MTSPHRAGISGCAFALAAIALAAALFTAGGLGYLSSAGRQIADLARSVEPSITTDAPVPVEPAPGYLGRPPEPRSVYPHIAVETTAAPITATHEFRFEGETYRVPVTVDGALYSAAKATKRVIAEKPGETEAQRMQVYFRWMVQDPVQAPVIAATARQLQRIAAQRGLDRSRYAEFIAKYVQSMPYDYSKLVIVDRQSEFPVVTLIDRTGVCGDKSLLLAALLAHEGYDTSLLLFVAEQHMAVGIRGPGTAYKDSGYLFIESTSPTYLSEIPTSYVSGVKLESDPIVIPVGEGSNEYFGAADVARIIKVRTSAKPAQDRLYKESLSRQLTPAEANAVNAKLDVAFRSQFKLNEIDGREAEYLDRTSALRWIAENVWWD